MDWLAGLSTEWVLTIAGILAVARLGLALARRRIGKAEAGIGEFLESLLFAWVVVFLIFRPFLYEPFRIPTTSMVPTLNIGDRIVVNRYLYRLRPPERGDIVVFKSPPAARKEEADFVKRLVGMPGELVDIQAGDLYIDGKPLNEPYLNEPHVTESLEDHFPEALRFPFRVPPGKYLVMGDNRPDSFDSRGWGLVEPWRLKGKAVLKFWPPKDFGPLR
ncbi:MAG: signal peptidase I [Armatimonadetes bacterium]|nr:signal peptidase I [Armatimonadota bacterium]